jgi:carbon-monoxide dehydrogenase small subunit
MAAKALLEQNDDPDVATIRDALAGNICRCTGYTKMIEAVRDAAVEMRAGRTKEKTEAIAS